MTNLNELRLKALENISKKPIASFYFNLEENVRKGICPTCGRTITKFRNDISEREYVISGMCQKCQDRIFGVSE